jgi:pimeloyl-ACP methyl ester carboxylesterase
MATFDHHGVRLAYDDIGSGPPIVLLHGFASSRKRNWQEVRWYDTLVNAGRRVVALDGRGHGESGKPREPDAYAVGAMVGDVVALLDHLGVQRTAVMGYSMGARLAAGLLVRAAARVTCAILAGAGRGLVGARRDAEAIARVLDADDAATITHPAGKAFRQFAEQGRNDLKALAACMRGLQHVVEPQELAHVRVPVLIVAGARDDMVGDPRELAALIPGAQVVVIPGRDHLSTVGDRRYKEAVLQFLDAHPAGSGDGHALAN